MRYSMSCLLVGSQRSERAEVLRRLFGRAPPGTRRAPRQPAAAEPGRV